MGPRMLPRMTPASTDFHSEVVSLITTRCLPSIIYDAIHDTSQVHGAWAWTQGNTVDCRMQFISNALLHVVMCFF